MINEERKESEEIDKIIYEVKTGVVNTTREGDHLKIIPREQIEFLENHAEVVSSESYVKLDTHISYMLSQQNFTQNESKLLWFILSHLGYKEFACLIVKKNGIHSTDTLSTKDIERLGGFKPKSLERAIKGLVKKEIIKVEKVGNKNIYLANPFIFHRGQKIQKKVSIYSHHKE